jgi:hypothetical protein
VGWLIQTQEFPGRLAILDFRLSQCSPQIFGQPYNPLSDKNRVEVISKPFFRRQIQIGYIWKFVE